MPERDDKDGKTAGRPRGRGWLERIFGLLLFGVGAALGIGGGWLVQLGGSAYYLTVGMALAAAGVLLALRKPISVAVFALAYLATWIWSLFDGGWSFWPMIPRIGPFLVMMIVMALFWGRLVPARRRIAGAVALLNLGLCLAGIGAMFITHGAIRGEAARAAVLPAADAKGWEWRHYAGTAGGTHYAPFVQIGPENVNKLEVAWTFRTGEINDSPDMQATPIQVGDSLYLCTAHNRIFALDTDTGRKKWSFDPRVDPKGTWNRCRGVGYFEAASRDGKAAAPCSRRIMATTVDARLFALDAESGQLCPDFGEAGFVDLTAGLGALKPGWYYPTSAPLVARGKVIVGGWVSDNQAVDEPGGVVRAFDAVTGKLAWAWDPGAADDRAGQMPAGFERSTPNFWGTATFDDELGLVFVPTGSGTSDHWGGMRSPATDAYSTSVIAIDIETGRKVWNFQTVHHDLWDWDLSAPPTFVDMPQEDGSTIPALVQVGKSGQIFVLDRRTGKPVTRVVERPVPQDGMPGDKLSPTQPYSVGMPQVIPQDFSEETMWGMTFFDQLACRIAFQKLRYEGQYTPPSLADTPITPGYLGGMNWGGVAIDPIRNLLLVNDIRVATIVRLVPRDEVGGRVQANFSHAGYELHAVEGAPYAVELKSFNSPLGLPCEQPPWGKITAIDLKSREIAWQLPAGTASEQTANLIGAEIPLRVGMPTISSGLMTASGLTFFAGANDPYLRAWDSSSGSELWRRRLPAGSQATPMSYVSRRSGRQFIVVVAGGTPYSKRIGDHVVAYSLPVRD